MGKCWSRATKAQLCKIRIDSGELIYSNVTIVNYTLLHTWSLLRGWILRALTTHAQTCKACVYTQKENGNCELMDILISLFMIISHYIHISRYQIVYFEYLQFLFVGYTSNKPGEGQLVILQIAAVSSFPLSLPSFISQCAQMTDVHCKIIRNCI